MLKKITQEQMSAIEEFAEEIESGFKMLKEIKDFAPMADILNDYVTKKLQIFKDFHEVYMAMEAKDMQRGYEENRIFEEINKPMGALIRGVEKC